MNRWFINYKRVYRRFVVTSSRHAVWCLEDKSLRNQLRSWSTISKNDQIAVHEELSSEQCRRSLHCHWSTELGSFWKTQNNFSGGVRWSGAVDKNIMLRCKSVEWLRKASWCHLRSSIDWCSEQIIEFFFFFFFFLDYYGNKNYFGW